MASRKRSQAVDLPVLPKPKRPKQAFRKNLHPGKCPYLGCASPTFVDGFPCVDHAGLVICARPGASLRDCCYRIVKEVAPGVPVNIAKTWFQHAHLAEHWAGEDHRARMQLAVAAKASLQGATALTQDMVAAALNWHNCVIRQRACDRQRDLVRQLDDMKAAEQELVARIAALQAKRAPIEQALEEVSEYLHLTADLSETSHVPQ